MPTIGELAKQVQKKTEEASANAQALQSPPLVDNGRCEPNCPECGGFGYFRYDVPTHHPYFGKLFPCPRLPLSSPLYNQSGLTLPERTDMTWALIHGRKDEKANTSLHAAVHAVVEALEKRRGMVLLYGGNGLAKSLILKIAIAETLRTRRGYMAKYTLMPELIEELRATYDKDHPGALLKEITEKYSTYPVLAVDELGVERDTPFSQEKQFVLIDGRYTAAIEQGEPLVTLLATNLDLSEFPARIRDRLSDGRCRAIKLVGESMRPGMK